MPYPNYHSARVRDPGDFEEDSLRTKDLPDSKGIMIIIGRLKGEDTMTTQAYRFPAENYTPEEAKKWLEEHEVKDYTFEAAKEVKGDSATPIRVKAIATKEGIWNGVYRSNDLLKSSAKWLKGIPVTLNHPQDGFADPDVAIGQVLDVEYDDQGAKAIVECELYPEKCPPELLQKIEAGEPIDVSTGFFTIQEDSPGKWNDQDYSKVEKTLFFDHLAIVPHGTCSSKDGCGIGVQSPPISLSVNSSRGINMEEFKVYSSTSTEIPETKTQAMEPPEGPAPVQIPLLEGIEMGPDGIIPKFGVTEDPEEAKTGFLKVLADSLAKKDAEIQALREQLTGIETAVRDEHMAVIKSYGFSDEEMEVYKDMPIEKLKTVSTHMAKLKVQDEKTKFTMPETTPKEPTKEDINAAYERKLGRKR